MISVDSFEEMGTFKSVRLGQMCGSAEGCILGTSCNTVSTNERTLADKIKAMKTPWDEWNQMFQVLVEQHVQMLEHISTCIDALMQRTEMVADQVTAWGNLQPELMKLGTVYRVNRAPIQMNDRKAWQLCKLKRRTRNVACFLCGQKHFAIVCPLKPMLEIFAVAQAQ